MQLSNVITPDRVKVPIAATDKQGAITELVDLLAATGALTDRDSALAAVLKREGERTTGIGFGLAIPHGKSDGCKALVMAAGKPAQPIDFQSYDRKPVTFITLLVSPPDQTGAHIQALAKISRLMNLEGFRSAIDAAGSAQALFDVIARFEAGDASA
ncbi:MAG: PTS sugar transporter subunit IIA [Phycisphaerales bacterium]|nr:PTS sugar transporter subunit IIA [Phycisphaerales bacterium]